MATDSNLNFEVYKNAAINRHSLYLFSLSPGASSFFFDPPKLNVTVDCKKEIRTFTSTMQCKHTNIGQTVIHVNAI